MLGAASIENSKFAQLYWVACVQLRVFLFPKARTAQGKGRNRGRKAQNFLCLKSQDEEGAHRDPVLSFSDDPLA